MIITSPDDLSQCDDQQLREIERNADSLRIRAIVELESRGRSNAREEYERKMAKRPPWAQTAAKLVPGPKGRIFAAIIFMACVMFPSLIDPLRSLYEKFEAELRVHSGQQGN
jgi:hypothetical protein